MRLLLKSIQSLSLFTNCSKSTKPIIDTFRRFTVTTNLMALSKWEYVKNFEKEDCLMSKCWIVVRVNGKGFCKLSNEHNWVKPNDIRGINLMNRAARSVMGEYDDIVLAYGESDEYSFVFRRQTEIFQRRKDKILTTLASKFSSAFAFYWNQYFTNVKLSYGPSFYARLILYPDDTTLRDYLCWRQDDCHINNLYNTTYWTLIQKGGLSNTDAEKRLLGTLSSDKNEILFSEYDMNYNNELEIFRRGTVLVRDERTRRGGGGCTKTSSDESNSESESVPKVSVSKDYRSITELNCDLRKDNFWTDRPHILLDKANASSQPPAPASQKCDYVQSFEKDDFLLPDCWVVARIDGRGFHKLAKKHNWIRPNDMRGINLMNRAAKSVMEEFRNIVLAYGQSDEYSFVFRRQTERWNNRILTALATKFSTEFVFHWTKYFTDLKLLYPPSFDNRLIQYPNDRNLRDYLCWRQADCHINNLYNTTFWTLVQDGGLSNNDAEKRLMGSLAKDKMDILLSEYGINYTDEPEIFRKGTVLVRDDEKTARETGKSTKKLHCDIIEDNFWNEHPHVLLGSIQPLSMEHL